MPGLMDYINNWKTMLSGGNQVDPNAQTPAAPPSALQQAISNRPTNPNTGEPMAANYGQDANLPSDDMLVKIHQLKKMGYSDDMAMRIITQSNHEKGQVLSAIMQGAPFKPQGGNF